MCSDSPRPDDGAQLVPQTRLFVRRPPTTALSAQSNFQEGMTNGSPEPELIRTPKSHAASSETDDGLAKGPCPVLTVATVRQEEGEAWDLNKASDVKELFEMTAFERPVIVTGSPP